MIRRDPTGSPGRGGPYSGSIDTALRGASFPPVLLSLLRSSTGHGDPYARPVPFCPDSCTARRGHRPLFTSSTAVGARDRHVGGVWCSGHAHECSLSRGVEARSTCAATLLVEHARPRIAYRARPWPHRSHRTGRCTRKRRRRGTGKDGDVAVRRRSSTT